MKSTVIALILALVMPSLTFAANVENTFLPKDLNQCVRSLDLPYSILTNRIEEDRLGAGEVRTNIFLNVQRMLIAADLDKVGCGKRVMSFTKSANNYFANNGIYFVFGRTDGTEARNRLGHFLRQSWVKYGGL